jgi:ribonuclease R
MNQTELEQSVLDFVNQPNYKPVKPRIIAKRLGLDEAAAVELKRTVKRLMKSGRLAYGQDHLVLPAATPSVANTEDETVATPARSGKQSRSEFSGERVTGVFRRMNAGYGFVRPSGAAPAVDRSGDIFIAANHAGDASSGDTVLVAVSRKRDIRRQNPEGEIIEILQRDTHQFVGTYFEGAGNGYVQVDGTVFSRPVYVGDPGAKNAQPDDKVVFEMVRFPSHFQDGKG